MTTASGEWLETDGLGGYAMGAADGVRSRRYHALLVSATRPPTGRVVLVADLEVHVETASGRHALSSHEYRGDALFPDGSAHIADRRFAPWPRWEFALEDGSRIAMEVWMVPGAPRVMLRWTRLAGTGPARLFVRPLLAGRDHHALHHENFTFRFDADVVGERVTWRPYEGVPSIVAIANGEYRHEPDWYRGFHYSEEAARGLDCEEDLATPGLFEMDLARGDAVIAFAADGAGLDPAVDAATTIARAADAEANRRDAFPTELARAADAYVVARISSAAPDRGRTIVAGYPWFTDWGRDTFVSLRGLCLATGRIDDARAIVSAWCDALSNGMLPNRFVEWGDAPDYGSVDAALWFVVAADALLATDACSAGERRAIEDAIDAIVGACSEGTRHGIHAGPDGLLACGEPGTSLTWMDAKVGESAITPRVGKPVEIQALWANALAIAGRRDARWLDALEHTRASFDARFWNASRAMLLDVVDCDHHVGVIDASLRPNQIFAVGGLPLALCDPSGERARAVVDAVEAMLWTPAGVRTLEPEELGYEGAYRGGPAERDAAYHQGTAWPWLLGPFVEAWVRVRGDTPAAKQQARERFLDPLLAWSRACGLATAHIAEVADGDAPHTAGGCPFQAWSVAEALRLDLDVLR
jgi:predicted glycogen debranching enzyme